MKEYYDHNASQPLFEIGQRVWVYTRTTKKGLSKKILYNWFGPYRIVDQSSPVHYQLRSKNDKKVTFAVHANRMKSFVHPGLRSIEPPIEDDLSEPYLDESDIPADSFQVSESSSHDNDTNVTAEKHDACSPSHPQEALDSSNQQLDDVFRLLLIINQFLLLTEFSRNGIEKANCNIRSNASTIPKINQPGNRRKIFWINVLSNILGMAKSEISNNLVCSMFESQFSICFIVSMLYVTSAE